MTTNLALAHLEYQSISFENVHNSWIQVIDFTKYKTALDIGVGSSRDALALKHKRLCVTAVEPSGDLRALGQTFPGIPYV